MKMKPFLVEMRITVVVMAEDNIHAMLVGNDVAREAMNDKMPKAYRSEPVLTEADLRDGWDGECIPYGGDGNTRINEFLAHN